MLISYQSLLKGYLKRGLILFSFKLSVIIKWSYLMFGNYKEICSKHVGISDVSYTPLIMKSAEHMNDGGKCLR